MVKREDLVTSLKAMDLNKLNNDGPTMLFLSTNKNERVRIALSLEKESIVATIRKFIFKRKFRINRSELHPSEKGPFE